MFRGFHNGRLTRIGLTLLELVVVMAILAALAGILIPLIPGMVEKASTSGAATNLAEVAKVVQMYATQHDDQYPDQLDSIVDTTGEIAGTVPNGGVLVAGGTTTVSAPLTAGTLNANDVTALNAVGVRTMAQMLSSSTIAATGMSSYWSATFDADSFAYGGIAMSPVTLAASTPVATVTGAAAAKAFGVPTSGRYIVFGLGQYATSVGTAMNKAPVWINPAAGQDPNSVYSRFGLVFQTADASGPLSRARFVGPVQFSRNGLLTQDDNLSRYSAQR